MKMDKKTKGAWIIHHARKLQKSTSRDFEALDFAGKCGLALSALAREESALLPMRRVQALAKASGINAKSELPTIISELERQGLVDSGSNELKVIGVSTLSILQHTVTIFDEGDPAKHEQAAVHLSELASESPIVAEKAAEYIADAFKLPSGEMGDLLASAEGIGFVDAEVAHNGQRLLFNGNLFRREDANKVRGVLDSLTATESGHVTLLNEKLSAVGCMTLSEAERVVGKDLFKRLHSIGLFDVNAVGNEKGRHLFVTRPAAFSKFTSSIADDAFDLAKALVSSLTYGMTISSSGRGRIQMIGLLMSKLNSGSWVGPATAIGNDYQALELRGVIELKAARGSMFYMRLLKREVGRLALAVIQEGDASMDTVSQLPGATVTQYVGPEENRELGRKNITPPMKRSIGNLLYEIRTGGLGK